MIHTVKKLSDSFCLLIQDDPVRPHIPLEQRVGDCGEIWVLMNEQDEPSAVVCVSWQDFVPISEQELFQCRGSQPTVAVFYTIWSMGPGGGQRLITEAQKHLTRHHPHIKRAVTLSPPTEMARKFHLRNGARELQINPTTVNFEYPLD
jgi:hypothetical protein